MTTISDDLGKQLLKAQSAFDKCVIVQGQFQCNIEAQLLEIKKTLSGSSSEKNTSQKQMKFSLGQSTKPKIEKSKKMNREWGLAGEDNRQINRPKPKKEPGVIHDQRSNALEKLKENVLEKFRNNLAFSSYSQKVETGDTGTKANSLEYLIDTISHQGAINKKNMADKLRVKNLEDLSYSLRGWISPNMMRTGAYEELNAVLKRESEGAISLILPAADEDPSLYDVIVNRGARGSGSSGVIQSIRPGILYKGKVISRAEVEAYA